MLKMFFIHFSFSEKVTKLTKVKDLVKETFVNSIHDILFTCIHTNWNEIYYFPFTFGLSATTHKIKSKETLLKIIVFLSTFTIESELLHKVEQ